MTRATVIGAGSWGTTFAKVLADGGARVTLWARREEVAREIREARRNTDYLPGITLPSELDATSDVEAALAGADQVYFAVPSQQLRGMLREARDLVPREVPVVSLMKGVEAGTRYRMSEVITQELDIDPGLVAVASGPNLALEIAQEQPTAVVVASTSIMTATEVARLARSEYFRSYINSDVVGTEFGGVLKNLIAVAIGIVDGVGYGENTKASIITRGLVEITDFAVAHGAQRETLQGLAGLGDLIATCGSSLSRNFTAGRLLGMGYAKEDVVARMNQVAEGLASIDPVAELAAAKGIPMPILQQVRHVVYGEMNPKDIAPHLTTDDEPSMEVLW